MRAVGPRRTGQTGRTKNQRPRNQTSLNGDCTATPVFFRSQQSADFLQSPTRAGLHSQRVSTRRASSTRGPAALAAVRDECRVWRDRAAPDLVPERARGARSRDPGPRDRLLERTVDHPTPENPVARRPSRPPPQRAWQRALLRRQEAICRLDRRARDRLGKIRLLPRVVGRLRAHADRCAQHGFPALLEIPTWHRNKGRHKPFETKSERQLRARRDWRAWLDRLPPSRQRILLEYELADLLLVQSTFAAETFLSAGIAADKIVYVARGADIERFTPAAAPPEKFRAIFAGALIKRKGVHHILEAWHSLALDNAELWLVGSVHPEIEPALREFASSSVKLQGFSHDLPRPLPPRQRLPLSQRVRGMGQGHVRSGRSGPADHRDSRIGRWRDRRRDRLARPRQ